MAGQKREHYKVPKIAAPPLDQSPPAAGDHVNNDLSLAEVRGQVRSARSGMRDEVSSQDALLGKKGKKIMHWQSAKTGKHAKWWELENE